MNNEQKSLRLQAFAYIHEMKYMYKKKKFPKTCHNGACRPGGQYWNHYTGSLSFSKLTWRSSFIDSFQPHATDLRTSCCLLTIMECYQDSSFNNGRQAKYPIKSIHTPSPSCTASIFDSGPVRVRCSMFTGNTKNEMIQRMGVKYMTLNNTIGW